MSYDIQENRKRGDESFNGNERLFNVILVQLHYKKREVVIEIIVSQNKMQLVGNCRFNCVACKSPKPMLKKKFF